MQSAHRPLSRLHKKPEGSLALNSNVAEVESVVPDGPAVIVVSGGVLSTVHECSAGLGSGLPDPSIARTRNVWAPLPSPEYAVGEEQAANDAPSTLHSNVAGSLAMNSKCAHVSRVVPDGWAEVIVVSGGVVSTVQVRSAGVGSVLPVVSVARTRNECGPSPRSL